MRRFFGFLNKRAGPSLPSPADQEPPAKPVSEYERKLAHEQAHFSAVANIHDLPPIFHYWTDKHIRPLLEEFDITSPDELFATYCARSVTPDTGGLPVFLSLGAGSGETEMLVAQSLRTSGMRRFVIECLDVNPALLERGRELARKAGLADHLAFVEADFNSWKADKRYSAIIANQALHHVVELEGLFDQIKESLRPGGYFVASDMIGRNGHLRWPEALPQVRRLWGELPKEYRWNRAFDRYEEQFLDYDCSNDGFEGIRAQDILPLLVERFDFHLFIAFANLIHVFVNRSIGYSFDLKREWDRQFIDRVHAFDEKAILNGNLTPTQMFAVMTPEPCSEHHYSRGLSPRTCIRDASKVGFPLRIESPSPLPSGIAGAEHLQRLSATGGSPPYTWSIVAGTVPDGLRLDAERAAISGQPSVPGTEKFTVRVADGDGKTAQAAFVLAIEPNRERCIVLPHITCGGGWRTRLHLINASPSQTSVKVRFRSDNGRPLTLPLSVKAGARTRELNAEGLDEEMPPYSSIDISTARETGKESPGWAEIVSSVPLAGHGTFDYSASTGVVTDLVAAFPASFLLPYDNTGGRKTGVALANGDYLETASVALTIWDTEWNQLETDHLNLPAGGHSSFLLADRFLETAAKGGIVEFRVISGNKVAGLGLRFHPEGDFYSIPILVATT